MNDWLLTRVRGALPWQVTLRETGERQFIIASLVRVDLLAIAVSLSLHSHWVCAHCSSSCVFGQDGKNLVTKFDQTTRVHTVELTGRGKKLSLFFSKQEFGSSYSLLVEYNVT
jgi:hypothetical protein